MNSSSIEQRLVGRKILASAMNELDYTGFIFDYHQLEFETLDSKFSKGIMKIIATEL